MRLRHVLSDRKDRESPPQEPSRGTYALCAGVAWPPLETKCYSYWLKNEFPWIRTLLFLLVLTASAHCKCSLGHKVVRQEAIQTAKQICEQRVSEPISLDWFQTSARSDMQGILCLCARTIKLELSIFCVQFISSKQHTNSNWYRYGITVPLACFLTPSSVTLFAIPLSAEKFWVSKLESLKFFFRYLLAKKVLAKKLLTKSS